jgi:cysteine synthase A
VTTEAAYQAARGLAQRVGISCGISSGAAVAGMPKVAGTQVFRNRILLAMLPDTGERHLSTDLWNLSGWRQRPRPGRGQDPAQPDAGC